ncbi:MAG: hypothetical protein RIR39_2006 [Pseudomonadota bacterium]|jgi:hypothetical protein
MHRKSSLLYANPILFSPIYLNAENISTEKLLALYRFANLFFPQMGSNLVNTLLDMEKNSERLTANSSPEERRKLIREIKGLSMKIQCSINDEEENMMDISINIIPGEVLERVQQGRNDLIEYQKLSKDFDKLISQLITKEIMRRFTSKVTNSFKGFWKSQQVPSFITQLLDMGWIDRNGQLLQGASIDELLTGKYHKQFEQLMPEELLQEGMQIRETIKTCFEISQEDTDSLILDAKKRHALLEITIREANKP